MLASREVPFFKALLVNAFYCQWLAFAAYFGIVYMDLGAAAQADTLFAFTITCKDEIL